MSSSRIPLASANPNRETVVVRNMVQKLKRRSIDHVNAANAAKRARAVVSRPGTPPSSSEPSTSVRAAPSTAARSLARPLSTAHVTGRATTLGVAPRSALRQPTILPPRVRPNSSMGSGPAIDAEKEEMKKEMEKMREKNAELIKRNEELMKDKTELRTEKDELRTELSEVKQDRAEVKLQITEAKTTISELRGTIGELRDELQAKREELAETKREAATTIAALKKTAIEKDEAVRVLHNDVVDLRGRVRVSVRVRPLLRKEEGEKGDHLSYPDESTIGFEQSAGKVQSFSFDHVYGPNYSQARIFSSVQDLITSVLHGYNVSLISFGQTGSGKTHTMRGGEDESAGLIPRAVNYLFEHRHRLEDLDWSFEFEASFMEVYNDACFDLLSSPARAKCEIKQVNKKFVVEGLTTQPITSTDTMRALLMRSDANRTTASTKCNETSSRSHAIFALHVKGTNGTTGAKIDCVLKLVDLAGSERAKETGAAGDRFNEMTHINTALSCLQNCIRSILTKQKHTPFRDSKLTMLLQDSLAGSSKCMVILSLSPQLSVMNETKRTLEFGRNLSQTHIGAAKKQES